MKKFATSKVVRTLASVAVLALLGACGGGGGSSGAGVFPGGTTDTSVAVTGTAAKGAAVVGAQISLTCANGAKLGGTTTGTGTYTTASAVLSYPCIGTATSGALTYRGILFSGSVANFTPLTDLLAEVALAAAQSGTTLLTMDQFIAKISSDAVYATNVTAAAASYRTVVLDAVKSQLIASGKTAAEATAILNAAQNFESTTFAVGSDLDKVLDATAAVLQDSNGAVKAALKNLVKSIADTLPTPASGATGAAGK